MPSTSSQSAQNKKRYAFDVLFVRRFWRLQAVLFPGGSLTFNGALFAAFVVVAGLEQFLAYNVGLIPSKYYQALVAADRNLDDFLWLSLRSLGIFVAMTVTLSTREFVMRSLVIGWRRTLTVAMHRLYFRNINFYQANVLDTSHSPDNPDQRMTADIALLTTNYGKILPVLILSPFTIAYYSYDAYRRAGWIGPTATFAFFFISTVVNKLLMNSIVDLTFQQEQKEGDFRFKHASIRASSEPLAFHGSVKTEELKADESLFQLCRAQQYLVNKKLILDLATNGCDYLSSISSYLVISVPIFSGYYDGLDPDQLAKLISENSFVCMYLMYQFSKLWNLSPVVAELAGVVHRVTELAETLAKMPAKPSLSQQRSNSDCSKAEANLGSVIVDPDNECQAPLIENNPSSQEHSAEHDEKVVYSLTNVSLAAPGSGTLLVENLNVTFSLGEHTLIMGKSSGGKSSLFRVLRGLWPLQSGEIFRSDDITTFFLPQRPFLTNGSLREQVVYPLQVAKSLVTSEDDAWIMAFVKELDLEDLLRRSGGSLDSDPHWSSWADMLSPGEMQRLAFIRLFYHRPQVAFLDEATAALSADVENWLYRKSLDMGITLVSIGHRQTLMQFHKRLLKLGLNQGGWTLENVESNSA